jgi:HK97 family phage major capsid protein
MATITAGMNFPAEVVTEMFNAVRGHSALGKLSDQKPIPFTGVTEFVFAAAGEASLVGEGDAKPAGNASVTAKVIKPVKFVYQQRVSDEFVRSGDETRLQYLSAFAEGFGRKIGRAFDISAIHGIEPATKAAASFKSTNSFDGMVTNLVTYAAATVDDNLDAAIQMITDGEVNGIALSATAGAALAAIKTNGVPQYPEYRFGQNPDAFYGMNSDVNTTVEVQETGGSTKDHVIVGDFQNAFRWGYAANIPLEVIEYGDPDGAGRDLKQYNEVCLRAEAYIGWGLLDPAAFAIVQA